MSSVLTALVAVEHVFILVAEMFLWTTPYGQRAFALTAEKAKETRVLAANQGLYNGFLAAGLVWSFVAPDPRPIRLFFLGCVVVAGVFGGLTALRKILYLQAVPAALALVASL
jgi:putative membrane protein